MQFGPGSFSLFWRQFHFSLVCGLAWLGSVGHAIFLGFVFSMIFAQRADHIANHNRTGLAVSKCFLSARGFIASVGALANLRRSCAFAFGATMGWFAQCKRDLTLFDQ